MLMTCPSRDNAPIALLSVDGNIRNLPRLRYYVDTATSINGSLFYMALLESCGCVIEIVPDFVLEHEIGACNRGAIRGQYNYILIPFI